MEPVTAVLKWFLFEDICRFCGRPVRMLKRTCPSCARAYPLCRPWMWYLWLSLSLALIPSFALFISWYYFHWGL
jgi:hypothetical protein